ncbi:hypothetical protein F6B40_02235 [Microbacterium caowuchunii]|uniref:Uncharacterized protein n=1 Tax=Microbacterium caowuchunii TaxID=2614638 RepID=A0A5N0TM66_9MICO|nr:hypothetical protein F6B40_02235 [Microbacterium caowuchunii]
MCCRRAPSEREAAWRENAWPNVRTPRTLLATLPTGTFPGVDTTEVYEFPRRPRSVLTRARVSRGSFPARLHPEHETDVTSVGLVRTMQSRGKDDVSRRAGGDRRGANYDRRTVRSEEACRARNRRRPRPR